MFKKLLIFGVTTYKKMVSPFLPKSCRYAPSCSDYAIQALNKYGVMKGSYLAAKRLLKCNRFFPGGFDPLN